MKTNFYILIVFLLTFSFSYAQNKEVKENTSVKITVNTDVKEEVEILDTLEIKEALVKTSDIRKFLNRERNEENIKYVFPDINRRKTA